MSGPRTASVDRAENANGRDSDEKNLVPSRRQYLDLKAQHPGAILLYRLGDFYETFDEDATILARDAHRPDLALLRSLRTGADGGHSASRAQPLSGATAGGGHTVAIAEQMTPPGRGLVERAVTRVISPGTVADPALLPAGENRYLAAVHRLGCWGLAWVDVSTGEFAVAEFSGEDAAARLAEEVVRLNPAETLVPDDAPDPPKAKGDRRRDISPAWSRGAGRQTGLRRCSAPSSGCTRWPGSAAPLCPPPLARPGLCWPIWSARTRRCWRC